MKMMKNFRHSEITKRLFIALKVIPDHKLVFEYSRIRSLLSGEKIRWVKIGNMHLTLLFLGNTFVSELPEIHRQLDSHIRLHKSFRLSLKTLGIFRSFRNPQVLWIGLGPSDDMIALKKTIDSRLRFLIPQKESDHFNFHLTLGRMKEIQNSNRLRELIESYHDFQFLEVNIKEVVLFESVMGKEGPVYKEISLFQMEG
jgi:2'-5' RNA ligase